ncbi:hypothetical protein DFH08DRAFT_1018034, partial [Mycena albidolilacea]
QVAGSLSTLSRHVRRFSVTKESELSPPLADTMTPIFSQFTNLEALELLSFTLTDKLNNAYCLKLLSFVCTVHAEASAFLESFLNRHQTITNLAFSRGDGPLAPLGPILLPNLTAYIGPSSFVSSFGGASRTIVCVVLLCKAAAALDTIIAIATSEDLSISTILRGVATQLPRIKTVKTMTPRLSRVHGILEIPSLLEHLDSLATLALRIDGGSPDEEREAVKRWGGACKSLC